MTIIEVVEKFGPWMQATKRRARRSGSNRDPIENNAIVGKQTMQPMKGRYEVLGSGENDPSALKDFVSGPISISPGCSDSLVEKSRELNPMATTLRVGRDGRESSLSTAPFVIQDNQGSTKITKNWFLKGSSS
ncbi:hypothetical protein V6N13_122396 [Hibiscus sabdariffa]